MTAGAGKYDDICTQARVAAHAEVAIVVIINGERGSGFSVQTHDPALLERLPDMLDFISVQLRADISQGGGGAERP